MKYACSMFCVPPLPEPGKCPVCGMDMVEVNDDTTGGNGSDAPRLAVSANARALAEIRTAPVVRQYVTVDVRLVGKVVVDETRRKTITTWVPGRIDHLFVDYVGVRVNRGDTMVKLFSPELIAAQEELIQVLKAAKEMERNGLSGMQQTTEATVAASRARLVNFGLTADQVAAVEQAGQPSDHVEIRAPQSGTVIEKTALEGQYVQTGTPIYTIADLSELWVVLDAYESDLVWIRYGQEVSFEAEAYPGKVFTGRIAFIDPVLDDRTRTVKVRVNVPNSDGRLKPAMLVRGQVRSRIAAGGRIMDPELAGKWISPRHPEIVKNGPGTCDRCGIALVKAEDLGYVALDPERFPPPLVIPASAPLITGRRAVVYVEVEPGVFEGRIVGLGPRAGDHYLVRWGLHAGEQVAVHGAFKIDSAMQIRARPSMMNPSTGPTSADKMDTADVYEADPALETSKTSASPVAPPASPVGKPQTLCPVMGKPIVMNVFTDHEGKRIYFCCPPCIDKFKADPDTFLKKLRDDGVTLQKTPTAIASPVAPPTPPAGKPQTLCPVMGKPIVKDVFTDHQGKRIYFCCPPCIDKFKADPDTFLKKLRDDGVTLQKTPTK